MRLRLRRACSHSSKPPGPRFSAIPDWRGRQCCASSSWVRPTSRSRRWPPSWRRARGRGRLYPAAPAGRARHGGAQVGRASSRRARRHDRRRAPRASRRRTEPQAFAAHRQPTSRWSWPTASSCRSRCWPRRAMAASTCMPPRCRAGAEPRRSSARSWRATPRRRPRSCAWRQASTPDPSASPSAMPIGPDMTAGELHDIAGRARRQPDGAGARRAGARRTRLHAAAGRRRHLRRQDRQGARPGIDFTRPAREVHNRIRGLSPAPGAWFEAVHRWPDRAHQAAARLTLSRTAGAPPGAVLDDGLADRLRRRRRALAGGAARRPQADDGGGTAARLSDGPGHAPPSARVKHRLRSLAVRTRRLVKSPSRYVTRVE